MLSAEDIKRIFPIKRKAEEYGSVLRLRVDQSGELVGECPLPGHKKSGTAPGGAFKITPSSGLFYCFKCERGGSVIDLVAAIEGLTDAQAMHDLAEEAAALGLDGSGNAEQILAGGSHRKVPVSQPAPAPSQPKAARGPVVATYVYTDEAGDPLFRVERHEPGSDGKPKDFVQSRYENGEWVYRVKGVRRVLYRLPDILSADTVCFVEGEKDADNLSRAGFVATTIAGGCRAPWADEYTRALDGKRVAVIPDQDEVGREHGVRVVRELGSAPAMVALINLPRHKDASEFIEREGADELTRLITVALERRERDSLIERGLLSLPEIISITPGGVGAFMDPSTRQRGVQTGFTDFDYFTLGLFGGQLILLAARPGVGKTALAMNIVSNAMRIQGTRCAVFALEMDSTSIAGRMMCALAEVNLMDYRAGRVNRSQRESLRTAASWLAESPLYIDDQSMATVETVRVKLDRLIERIGGIDLVVIDYLQLMTGKGENRNQEVSAISRGLKIMARDFDVPFLVLSQLSRASEMRTGHEPQLSDLRDSGALEQDADVVTFVHRPEMQRREDASLTGVAYWDIAKQRNGPQKKIKLFFRKELTRFENLADASLREVVA